MSIPSSHNASKRSIQSLGSRTWETCLSQDLELAVEVLAVKLNTSPTKTYIQHIMLRIHDPSCPTQGPGMSHVMHLRAHACGCFFFYGSRPSSGDLGKAAEVSVAWLESCDP